MRESYLVSFTIGDGHTTICRSSHSKEEIEKAFLKGGEITGLNLREIQYFRNYEFPPEILKPILERTSLPFDTHPNSLGYISVYADEWWEIFKAIIRIANPEIVLEPFTESPIWIGGFVSSE
jgi:hypothetical protein